MAGTLSAGSAIPRTSHFGSNTSADRDLITSKGTSDWNPLRVIQLIRGRNHWEPSLWPLVVCFCPFLWDLGHLVPPPQPRSRPSQSSRVLQAFSSPGQMLYYSRLKWGGGVRSAFVHSLKLKMYRSLLCWDQAKFSGHESGGPAPPWKL